MAIGADSFVMWAVNSPEKVAREAGRSEGRADEICAELVRTPKDYSRRSPDLRAARRAVVDALLALGK